VNLSWYIAQRYLFHWNRSTAINIITAITALGIIAGSMSLFVVLSVFSGLRGFSLSFVQDFDPDLKISAVSGKILPYSADLEQLLKNNRDIACWSQVVEERVLFCYDGKEVVAFLKGVDANYVRVNGISQRMFTGQWIEAGTSQCVAGYGISHKLSLGVLDFQNPFEVYVPKPGEGLIESESEAFRSQVLLPVGVYAINEELDGKFVFCDLRQAQALMGYGPKQFSHIEIRIKEGADVLAVQQKLQKQLGNRGKIQTRQELNETLTRMLNTENLAVYLIFTLVLIIALFNLVGALLMVIIEKQHHLQTLSALGMTVAGLRAIFWFQGTLLSVYGGIIGLLLGMALVFGQSHVHWIMITESLPYPIEWHFENAIAVLGTIVVLGALASAIACSRIRGRFLEKPN